VQWWSNRLACPQWCLLSVWVHGFVSLKEGVHLPANSALSSREPTPV
jgi:hypothetical protein